MKKVNEAPEKLYFNTSDINGILDIYSNKDPHDSLEYTRTDAFVDKACEWLKEIFAEYENLTDYNPTEDFRKAMKGE